MLLVDQMGQFNRVHYAECYSILEIVSGILSFFINGSTRGYHFEYFKIKVIDVYKSSSKNNYSMYL